MVPPSVEVRKEDPSKYMYAVSHLLPSAGHGQGEHLSGLRYVSIDCPVDLLPGMLAGLRANNSLQSVYFDPNVNFRTPDDKRRLAWSWLAYGAFSKPPSGGHRIQELLVVAETLDQMAVDGITAILRADDPLALLFNLEVGRISQETISASQFALVDPTTSQNIVKWGNGRTYDDLEVIERGQDWMSVLLPGWGKAWVRREDLITAGLSASSANRIQAIPKLMIRNMNWEAKDALAGLIRLIGRGVRHLDLEYDPRRSVVDELLPQIFQACPNMKTFKTSCKKIESFQLFVDAFSSGTLRLERLYLTDILVTDERDSVKRMFDALSDMEQPIAQYLKELTFYSIHVDSIIDPAVTASLSKMLQNNQRLRHLDIVFRREDYGHPRIATCGDLFKRFDKQTIVTTLNLPSKLAFLSVLAANPSQDDLEARQKLDSSIVSKIFKFATTIETRRVAIRKA